MKNAITVIDQELIDDAKNTIKLNDDACDRSRVSIGTLKDLILMCEDLIEINAEITKREQKIKSSLAVCANYLSHALNLDDVECEEDKASIHSKINDFLMSANEELKGDSDE